MGAVEKPLTLNQKILMELAGQESTSDWSKNLGDTRLLASRVMIKKLIRLGGEDILTIIAEYYGAQILKEKDVLAYQKIMNDITHGKRNYSYEYIEDLMFKRMNDKTRNKRENSSSVTVTIDDKPVVIQIALVEEKK